MIETYLAVKDLQVRDQLRMAFRMNPAFRVSTVPPADLLGLITEPTQADLVITDAEADEAMTQEAVARIREASPRAAVALVGDRSEGSPLNRARLEHGVTTVIATPIDPFDLARRIFRLHAVLTGGRSQGQTSRR
jgi:AmiR/NasT family two-component response regulator